MTKHAVLTIVGSLAVFITAPARADCLSYEPNRVSVAGTLTRIVFPGPPNYESVARGDRPEPYFVLRLQEPVCVKGRGRDADEPFLSDILAIQLGLTEPQYAQFRPLLGKRVRLSGSLAAATTGHHHTPVLMGDVVLEER
jgi:hypothetical protein